MTIESKMTTVRLEYDDHGLDVIDKVNRALQSLEIGYLFVDDGQDHDGYCIFTLVQSRDAKTC